MIFFNRLSVIQWGLNGNSMGFGWCIQTNKHDNDTSWIMTEIWLANPAQWTILTTMSINGWFKKTSANRGCMVYYGVGFPALKDTAEYDQWWTPIHLQQKHARKNMEKPRANSKRVKKAKWYQLLPVNSPALAPLLDLGRSRCHWRGPPVMIWVHPTAYVSIVDHCPVYLTLSVINNHINPS